MNFIRLETKNEELVAAEAVVNVTGAWQLGDLIDAVTVGSLQELAVVLEDADRYYRAVRKPSLAKAACAVRERVIDQIVAAGGSVPKARVGAEKRFVS